MSEFATGGDVHMLTDMIRAERMIAGLVDRELQAWVAKFLDKMQASAIAGIAPDLTQLEYLREEWEFDSIPVILAAIALAYRKRYKKKRKTYSEAGEEEFLLEARRTLELIPDRTFNVATEAIRDGIRSGFTSDALLNDLVERVLASVTLTAERTGRLIGPGLINTATLNSYLDSQDFDGEGPFVKSWVSVMDSHVRPTHMLAHAADENRNIPLRQKFVVGGFVCDVPRDFDLPIWESAGCRCICSVKSA